MMPTSDVEQLRVSHLLSFGLQEQSKAKSRTNHNMDLSTHGIQLYEVLVMGEGKKKLRVAVV